MNEIVCAILLWCLFIITKVRSRRIYSPAVMFTLLWAIIVTLYSFHLNDLYHAKEKYIFYLFIGIVSFWLGCQISGRVTVKRIYPYHNMTINERMLELLSIFSMIVLTYGSIHNLRNISLSVYMLRYGGEMNISTTYVILRDFFAVPVVYVCICYFAAQVVMGRFKLKWALYTILLVFLDILALFEQIGIYAFAFSVMFILLYYIENKKEAFRNLFNRRIKRYTRVLVVVMLVLIVILVNLREIDLFNQIYNYTSSSVMLFSIDMDTFQSLGRTSDVGRYTYGLASFQGVIRIFFSLLEEFWGYTSELFESASYFYATFLATPKHVAPYGLYNSFATMFIYFYKDFGFIGIPIMSFLYGGFSQKIFSRSRKRQDVYSISLYIFIFITIFFTYMQSPFADKKIAFAIILIVLLRKRDMSNNEMFSRHSNI